jgi:hypothetical protein
MAIPIYIDLPILPVISSNIEDIKSRLAQEINTHIIAIRNRCPHFEINAWNALEIKRRAVLLLERFNIYNFLQSEEEYNEENVRLCLVQLINAADRFPAWLLN